MIAEVICHKSFEGSKKNEYLIKNYQRGYRWDIPQIKSLLDDIYGNFKRYYFQDKRFEFESHLFYSEPQAEISTQYAYCLQPLVVKNDLKTGKYSVIDGQQRLTTIAMIMNALDNNITDSPDKVSIAYESKSISIDEICKICDNNIAGILEDHKGTDFNSLEKKCDDCLKNIYDGLPNIDAKFMARGYVYIRLYYKTIINQVKKYVDEINNNGQEDKIIKKEHEQDHLYFVYKSGQINQSKIIILLKNVIKYCTTVIWYEPLKDKGGDKKEEDIFKNFNSGKIPLTKSELVKALLMNPDNYTKNSDDNISSEAIKTRQILIASKWDEIEKKLHDEELWHFFPHYDDWHNSTRFDALIDYFVYCEYMDRCKNSDDYKALQNDKEKEKFLGKIDLKFQNNIQNDTEHYTYKLLEKFIKEDLLKAESSDDKTEKMKKWWKKICDTFSSFEVYISNDKKIIEQFHRISLLKWMDDKYFKNVTNKGNEEQYLKQTLSQNYEIFTELASKRNSEKNSVLNKLINQKIQKIFDNQNTVLFSSKDTNGNVIKINKNDCKDLSKKIRALVYSPDYEILVEAFLKIFTLYIMEKSKSDRARYPFFSDEEEKWEREHIFAKNTSFSDYKNKTPDEKKKFINDVIGTDDTGIGWEKYLRFKYEDLLQASEIESIIKQKQNMIDCLEECLADIEKNPNDTEKFDYIFDESIKGDLKEFIADSGAQIEFDPDDNDPSWDPNFTILQFLRDNSMGNMCMLPQKPNKKVGCKPYYEKKELLINELCEKEFIPISTLMVFSGAYCAKYSAEYWYPCHRKKYLETMIKGVENYLKY